MTSPRPTPGAARTRCRPEALLQAHKAARPSTPGGPPRARGPRTSTASAPRPDLWCPSAGLASPAGWPGRRAAIRTRWRRWLLGGSRPPPRPSTPRRSATAPSACCGCARPAPRARCCTSGSCSRRTATAPSPVLLTQTRHERWGRAAQARGWAAAPRLRLRGRRRHGRRRRRRRGRGLVGPGAPRLGAQPRARRPARRPGGRRDAGRRGRPRRGRQGRARGRRPRRALRGRRLEQLGRARRHPRPAAAPSATAARASSGSRAATRAGSHPRLRFFAGREDPLPTDAHELLACIAPRPLLLSGALHDESESTSAAERTWRPSAPPGTSSARRGRSRCAGATAATPRTTHGAGAPGLGASTRCSAAARRRRRPRSCTAAAGGPGRRRGSPRRPGGVRGAPAWTRRAIARGLGVRGGEPSRARPAGRRARATRTRPSACPPAPAARRRRAASGRRPPTASPSTSTCRAGRGAAPPAGPAPLGAVAPAAGPRAATAAATRATSPCTSTSPATASRWPATTRSAPARGWARAPPSPRATRAGRRWGGWSPTPRPFSRPRARCRSRRRARARGRLRTGALVAAHLLALCPGVTAAVLVAPSGDEPLLPGGFAAPPAGLVDLLAPRPARRVLVLSPRVGFDLPAPRRPPGRRASSTRRSTTTTASPPPRAGACGPGCATPPRDRRAAPPDAAGLDVEHDPRPPAGGVAVKPRSWYATPLSRWGGSPGRAWTVASSWPSRTRTPSTLSSTRRSCSTSTMSSASHSARSMRWSSASASIRRWTGAARPPRRPGTARAAR